MNIALYIIVMAGVTYLIRVLPFAFFRKKITSRFLKSFLYYVPYAVLSAMTIPSIFESTGNIYTAIVGTGIAIFLAYLDLPLIAVSLAAALGAFLTGFFV